MLLALVKIEHIVSIQVIKEMLVMLKLFMLGELVNFGKAGIYLKPIPNGMNIIRSG